MFNATQGAATMHASAVQFALRHHFRLARNVRPQARACVYFLVNGRGERIDTPATKGHTAAGALRMMRRHLRLGIVEARAI